MQLLTVACGIAQSCFEGGAPLQALLPKRATVLLAFLGQM